MTLSLWIPNLVLSFQRVIQDVSRLLTDDAEEHFSSVILYYQCKSGHDFICLGSPSSSIFQETDSGRFSFTNQEVITLTL